MELSLKGKVAIVTGGSRGIGRAICNELLAEGVTVASCSRHAEDFEDLKNEYEADRLYTASVDVTDVVAVGTFVQAVATRFGRVDILVNNAGRCHPGTFQTLTDEDWLSDIQIKQLAYIRFSRAVLPFMSSGGRIINMAAVFGKQPDHRYFASSTNRAACISMTKALAKELGPKGILVNAVNIGFVHSGQWEGRPDSFFDDIISTFGLPLGRFGEAGEVADLVTFLASSRSSYITGTAIDVDGGLANYL